MKVMYVACNAKTQSTLELEREVTELQRRSLIASGESVHFQFFPDLNIEQLPATLSQVRPDILHISAHGAKNILAFANQFKEMVVLTSEMLAAFLHPEYPPRIVYLNACNSEDMAKELTKYVPMAIGTTASITNHAAVSSAMLFYERLIGGLTVRQAFEAGNKMIEALHSREVSSRLFYSDNSDPSKIRMYNLPRIVARFAGKTLKLSKRGDYWFEFGVTGCPRDTAQIVFITDDETYLKDTAQLETDLCLVARTTPVRGVLWSEYDEWYSEGDIRLYACISTAGGEVTALASTLCEAIEAKYRYFDGLYAAQLPQDVQEVIGQLRAKDGARIENTNVGTKPIKKKRSKN